MKKVKLTLEEELKRYQKIFGYGQINEADEFNADGFGDDNAQQPEEKQPDQQDDTFGADDATGDNGFGDTETNTDGFGDTETEPGGDTEVDVSDLVKGIEDSNNASAEVKMQIDNAAQKIETLLNKIGGLEDKLGVMDALLQKVDQLGISVEKMRPPTERERQEIMKQNSYPFNQTPEDYLNQAGEKNATELEQRQSKLSFKDILKDFNAQDVQSSFNYNDPVNTEINKFMPPYHN